MGRRFEGLPEWDGTPTKEQRILLKPPGYGFGDSIHFVRFAHLLRLRCATPVVMCQPALRRLFTMLSDVEHLVSPFDSCPPLACWFDAGHLRELFSLSIEAAGAMTPYLRAPKHLLPSWRERLNRPGLRVGLCWRSEAEHNLHQNPYSNRDVPLECFSPLLAISDTVFFSLQYGATPAEMLMLRELGIVDLGYLLSDFADTAAAMTNLDVIVSVDTAVAHLAGALARPTLLLLPLLACKRWLAGRPDSPWYPTSRLFRQSKPGDWSGPIEAVARDLCSLAPTRRLRQDREKS
jgi:hypothetical protein